MDVVINLMNSIIDILKQVGPLGGFFLVLLESVIPALPLGLFIGFNIVSFGSLWGLLISYLATNVGCILSFFLFRYFFRDKYNKFIRKKNLHKLENLTTKISNIDFNLLVVLIACPFSPAFLINIAGGLSKISRKKFILALLIGKISIVYFWGYIGKSFLESVKNPIVLLKILFIILIAYIISKVIEKIIKVD